MGELNNMGFVNTTTTNGIILLSALTFSITKECKAKDDKPYIDSVVNKLEESCSRSLENDYVEEKYSVKHSTESFDTVNIEFFKFVQELNIEFRGIDPEIRAAINEFNQKIGKRTPSKKRF